MSFFNKIKSDITFIEGLVKSKNFDEVKDKVKQQYENDKKFLKEIGNNIKEKTNIVQNKIENDIVFVKKMTEVESITDVVDNIKEQVETDKEFVKDITGVDIQNIEDKVVDIIKTPITPIIDEYDRLYRAFIVFNILLYLFDTKLFFIFWISYAVYKFY